MAFRCISFSAGILSITSMKKTSFCKICVLEYIIEMMTGKNEEQGKRLIDDEHVISCDVSIL